MLFLWLYVAFLLYMVGVSLFKCGNPRYCLVMSLIYCGLPWNYLFGYVYAFLGLPPDLIGDWGFFILCPLSVAANVVILYKLGKVINSDF